MKVAVTTILHSNDYQTIFSGITAEGTPIIVKSQDLSTPQPGAVYEVQGTPYITKNSWGRPQLRLDTDRLEIIRPSGNLCLPLLERLKGIGKTRAQRLLNVFGEDIFNVLCDPGKIEEISAAVEPERPKIGAILAVQLQSYLLERKAADITANMQWRFFRKLEYLGISNCRAANRLWRLIGSQEAEAKLLHNPYLSVCVLPWKEADLLGKRILAELKYEGNPLYHPERLLGACDSTWQRLLAKGDTAASEKVFTASIPRGVSASAALKAGLSHSAILKRGELLRAPGAAWLEDDLAQRLRKIAARPSSIVRIPIEVTSTIRGIELSLSYQLTEEQRQSVCQILNRPLSILQGGAGTGKTSTLKVLVEAWEHFGGEVVMCAVAGKAALQMSRSTSSKTQPRLAFTIARLINLIQGGSALAKQGKSIPKSWPTFSETTLLVIDEASMVDTASLHQLVELLPLGAHIVLVGDNGQLPPVGIGSVFHDLVKDGRYVSNLSAVLRQATDSPIPHIATKIRTGEVPDLPPLSGKGKGVFLYECVPADITKSVPQIWVKLGSDTSDIICAVLKASVRAFNSFISSSHKSQAVRLGPLVWIAPGDPVVCTRNRYKEGLFNGMLGVVDTIRDDGPYIIWDGEDEPRKISSEAASELELAYAITCHKAQGSSARRVIVPLEDCELLTREWLYTAITRATEQVILVGPQSALTAAVNRRTSRITGFDIRGDLK